MTGTHDEPIPALLATLQAGWSNPFYRRLWQGQGRQAEARQALLEVYSWFTEGFGTADLLEAKALLDEL